MLLELLAGVAGAPSHPWPSAPSLGLYGLLAEMIRLFWDQDILTALALCQTILHASALNSFRICSWAHIVEAYVCMCISSRAPQSCFRVTKLSVLVIL
jgi:hypothetical protein